MLQLLLLTKSWTFSRPALVSASDKSHRSGYLPQLDAVRGLACLTVLIAHLNSIPTLAWIPDVAGPAGVGLFFALSGFLITRILITEKAAGLGLSGFYNRRVARIFPIYYLTLAALALTWPGREIGWAAAFTFNFRFLADSHAYFRAEAVPPVAHFWSLCVEEHFYWIWPAAVMLLPRFALRGLLVAVIAATPVATYYLAEWLSAVGFSESDVRGLLSRLTLTQLVAISIGALAALHESWLLRRVFVFGGRPVPRAVAVGLVAMTAAAGWFWAAADDAAIQEASTGTILHLACGGIFLMALGLPGFGRVRLLGAVGTISYALYLFHLPVYAALGLTDPSAELKFGVAALAITFLLSILSYRYLETPILRRAKPVSDQAGVGRSYRAYWGIALTAVVASASVVDLTGFYLELRALSAPVAAPSAEVIPETPSEASPATPPDFRSRIQMIAVGSCHAELGIAAPEFRDVTYNFGFAAQDLWYDCQIVEMALDRLPGLKRVLFCVDGYSLHSAISEADGHRWRQSLYFHTYGVKARVDDPRSYNPLVLGLNEEAKYSREVLKRKATFADEPLRGWNCQQRSEPFDPELSRKRARDMQTLPPRLEENAAVLARTLEHCRQRGVQCVLVTLPTHSIYRESFAAAYQSETKAAIDRVVRETGVAYFDYEADPRFTDADYFDCGDHLNKTGATRFAKLLQADLDRRTHLRKP